MNLDFQSLGSISGAIAANALLIAAAHGVGRWLTGAGASRPSMDRLLLRISAGLSLVAALGVTLGAAKCLSGSRSVLLLGALSLLNLAGFLRRKNLPLARRPLYARRP